MRITCGGIINFETRVRSELHRRGLRFRKHVPSLPGKPDIVFHRAGVAVFLDGDFWHGYRFPSWRHSLAPFWQDKIEATRGRDQRNFRRLRRAGWQVIRLWQHEVESNFERSIACIEQAVQFRTPTRNR